MADRHPHRRPGRPLTVRVGTSEVLLPGAAPRSLRFTTPRLRSLLMRTGAQLPSSAVSSATRPSRSLWIATPTCTQRTRTRWPRRRRGRPGRAARPGGPGGALRVAVSCPCWSRAVAGERAGTGYLGLEGPPRESGKSASGVGSVDVALPRCLTKTSRRLR
jgi:hypothetical protein